MNKKDFLKINEILNSNEYKEEQKKLIKDSKNTKLIRDKDELFPFFLERKINEKDKEKFIENFKVNSKIITDTEISNLPKHQEIKKLLQKMLDGYVKKDKKKREKEVIEEYKKLKKEENGDFSKEVSEIINSKAYKRIINSKAYKKEEEEIHKHLEDLGNTKFAKAMSRALLGENVAENFKIIDDSISGKESKILANTGIFDLPKHKEEDKLMQKIVIKEWNREEELKEKMQKKVEEEDRKWKKESDKKFKKRLPEIKRKVKEMKKRAGLIK